MDYYYLFQDYFRRKLAEKWESPRIDDIYELESTAQGYGKKEETKEPIPFV